MNILSVASEAVPFCKTGGLADVAGALPGAMARLGHKMVTVLPLYRAIDRTGLTATGLTVSTTLGGTVVNGQVWTTERSGNTTYFIQHDGFFDRDGLYGEGGHDYDDNATRFAFFVQAALKLCRAIDFVPELIHCHDWQSAMLPVYLKETPDVYPELAHTATCLTIHNLAYQGMFGYRDWATLSLPERAFSIDGLEFHGGVNFLKGGMKYADVITTVSGRYAEEIQQEAFGHGLDGVARFRSDDLFGIVNGIDTTLWNPADDPTLSLPFSAESIDGREANREFLRHATGLAEGDGPIVGMVGRLAEQKGLSLLLDALDELMTRDLRLVILGEGDPQIVGDLTAAAERYGDRLKLSIGFSEDAARRIYAGCDLFLMPSRFEPCGLAQLIAMRYGAPPVVHRVGGLADTVRAYGDDPDRATGFAFDGFSPQSLLDCMDEAIKVFHRPDDFRKIQLNAMTLDVSWQASAKGYEAVYRSAQARRAVSSTRG